MSKIPKAIKKLHDTLPKFPDGRIDYTNAREAAVLSCFVEFNGKLLLLKRSDKVGTYQNQWSSVGGYLDELKTLEEKVQIELVEELGISPEEVAEFVVGEIYESKDEEIDTNWIIHPTLVKLKSEPTISLDWEHTEFTWISPDELMSFEITPHLDESLRRVL